MYIGEKIKLLRQNKKMTQKELAMKSGISVSSIISYENGLREPKVDTIKCLCDIFEITPEFFYEWMGDNQGLEENHYINRLLKRKIEEYTAESFTHTESVRHYTNSLIYTAIKLAEALLERDEELSSFLNDNVIATKLLDCIEIIGVMDESDLITLTNLLFSFCSQPKYYKYISEPSNTETQ